MASFFEKAVRTAKVAKAQIEVAKAQVDELRAAHAETTASSAPAGPHGLGTHESGVLARAIELGAPDPFDLLSREEAAGILDAPVDAGSLTYSDDATGVRFVAEGSRGARSELSVSVHHGIDADDSDGRAYWENAIEGSVDDATPVAGLGDQALWTGSYLFVRRGARVLYTEATTPAGPDDARDRAVAAARIALDRLAPR